MNQQWMNNAGSQDPINTKIPPASNNPMLTDPLELERLTYLVQELAANPRALRVLLATIDDFRRMERERIAQILDVWAAGQGSIRFGDDTWNDAIKMCFKKEAQDTRTLDSDSEDIQRFIATMAERAGYPYEW